MASRYSRDEKQNDLDTCISNSIVKLIGKCSDYPELKTRGRKPLGQGEFGAVWTSLDHPKTRVIKVVSNQTEWKRESCIGKIMSNIQVGPEIFGIYDCDSKGYVIMEKIKTMPSKIANDQDEHPEKLSDLHQLQIIAQLETMIESGFIHNDNHLGNIGFRLSNSDVVLYDFGFTVQHTFQSLEAKKCLLAWSLFQVIDHAEISPELEDSILYRISTSCLLSSATSYPFGEIRKQIKTNQLDNSLNEKEKFPYEFLSLKQLAQQFPPLNNKRTCELQVEKWKKSVLSDKASAGVYTIGVLCYAHIMSLQLSDRLENYLYDILYEVRKSKPI